MGGRLGDKAGESVDEGALSLRPSASTLSKAVPSLEYVLNSIVQVLVAAL